ncbi:hypothetical protein SO802_033376 [Lithocarpus litseifolius]|uniref:Uncharacterized protein n=1 Tax=Lithocarpus litseifolius TaxID=425828 RepID=A0AAW2BCR1_9ROSI
MKERMDVEFTARMKSTTASQYQELIDHYDLCRARLIDLLSEAESLRHENAELRLANAELLKLLSSQASFHNLLLSSSYPTEAIVKKSFFFFPRKF